MGSPAVTAPVAGSSVASPARSGCLRDSGEVAPSASAAQFGRYGLSRAGSIALASLPAGNNTARILTFLPVVRHAWCVSEPRELMVRTVRQ